MTKVPRFVKWAGGKEQLLDQLVPLFPNKFNRFIEPFVGGGAVLFYVLQNFSVKEIIISDINSELMNAYSVVKNDVEALIKKLRELKQKHDKEHFYVVREQAVENLDNINRAARLIYLNRTCFNGLYRVNSKGKFNVPIGSYKNPDIVQEEKLRLISKLLKNVKIRCESFENVLKYAKKNDFVYFDPPYHPLENKKSFTTYNKDNFLEEEQKKLAQVFQELSEKGCFCMQSNSDTKFIKELYKKYKITKVNAKRLINSKADQRGPIKEVVITNY